jgi:hypothetical protein
MMDKLFGISISALEICVLQPARLMDPSIVPKKNLFFTFRFLVLLSCL